MKTPVKLISLLLMLSIGIWITPQNASAKGTVSYQVFYDDLSPYGTWVGITNYGYVWRPNVAPGFTPYATNGYWDYTDEGWTWISNYPWGWAPFHYGRWYDDPIYGSFWIPGSEWGPGWVDWRNTDGYYGWTPMGPFYNNGYYAPYNRWTYVKGKNFGKKNNKDYYFLNSSYNGMVNHKSKALDNFKYDKISHTKYNAGPSKSEVEKYNGKKISPLAISGRNKPGQNLSKNQLSIYKPEVQKNSSTGIKPSQYKASGYDNAKKTTNKSSNISTQKTSQSVKQKSSQTQNTNTSKKTEVVKQQQQTKPSQKVGGMKQQQYSPSKQAEGNKQSPKGNTSKKGK